MDRDVRLNIRCAGMINGEILTAEGKGVGSVDDGTLRIELSFSVAPEGWSVLCASLWTACCSTPTFAVERKGGRNMLNIAKGRYRCERTFDFGLHGSYDYKYEIRLEQDQMTATGMIHGSLHLPEIVDVERTFTEIMVPVNAWEIRSFARTSFKAADEEIPVSVSGKYTPLMSEETDWHCCARNNQVRRSWIDIRQADPQLLSLDYRTVIQAIEAPELDYAAD